MRSFFCCLLVFGLVLAGVGRASGAILVERSVGAARVSRVAPLPGADLVLIDAGFEAGFREGMVCVVSRDGDFIGELLLVELRSRAASALILDLQPGFSLQSGDSVVVKTVSSRK